VELKFTVISVVHQGLENTKRHQCWWWLKRLYKGVFGGGQGQPTDPVTARAV